MKIGSIPTENGSVPVYLIDHEGIDPSIEEHKLGRIIDFFGRDCTIEIIDNSKVHAIILINGNYKLTCSRALTAVVNRDFITNNPGNLKYYEITYWQKREWLIKSFYYTVEDKKHDPTIRKIHLK